METSQSTAIPRSLLAPTTTVVAGAIWLVAALRTPTNTYHFAPIIVAAAWPFLARGEAARTTRQALTTATASTSVALGIAAFLWMTDRLRGPTLWESDAAAFETILFALLGGGAGLIAQLRHRRPG